MTNVVVIFLIATGFVGFIYAGGGSTQQHKQSGSIIFAASAIALALIFFGAGS